MKKTTRKTPIPLPSFESGQIWQIGDTNLQIGLVGKRLVHYKHYKAQAKRPSTQLLGKTALESFLQKNRAILLPEAPPVPTAAAAARRPAPPASQSRPAGRDRGQVHLIWYADDFFRHVAGPVFSYG